MEGIKTYRFPSISSAYSQALSRVGHIQPPVSKVSSCVIDTPRDNGQRYRENLWTYQKHNRGVKSQDDPFPDIPFRLRTSFDEFSSDNIHEFPPLERSGTGNGSFTERSFLRPLTRRRTPQGDPMPQPSKNSPFIATGTRMPFSKSLTLCSRDRRPDKPGRGASTERLPRVESTNQDMTSSPPMKRSASLVEVREDEDDGHDDDASSMDSDQSISSSIDIHSDKIGHTTNTFMETTLADILNRHNNTRYYDLGSRGRSNQILEDVSEADPLWIHKFETKVVDGNAYNSFARTSRPELEKEASKGEQKSLKRRLSQKSTETDVRKSIDLLQKDTPSARRNGQRRLSKSKQTSANNRQSN